MKTIILLSIAGILFNSNPVKGQNQGSKNEAENIICASSDLLYYNETRYLLDKSFLSSFKNYQSLYPSKEIIMVEIHFGAWGNLTDKNYYPIWLLHDSILYLRDIQFRGPHTKEKYANGKQYKIMEKLTGCKFSTDFHIKTSCPINRDYGSMRADWVTGVFYIKEEYDPYYEWKKKPLYKLVFKNGKLISSKPIKP